MLKFLTAAAVLAAVCIVSAVAKYETNEIEDADKLDSTANRGRIIKDIFKNYDRRNYPSNNTLKFGLALRTFGVDEAGKLAVVDAWLREVWTDKRLQWDPKEYGGETVVRIPADNVWKPDLTLYNTALSKEANECRDTNVLVYNTGSVLWVPPCQFRAYCNLTLDIAPYGEQKCSLKFGSWTYDGFILDLQFYNGTEKADVADFTDITDYEITGNTAVRVNKKYDCCEEPYPYISFDLTFQRKRNAHSHTQECKV